MFSIKIKKIDVAVFIALLFHVSGAIGILFSSYKDWFIQNTPMELMLMTVLLFWLQPQKSIHFFLFFAIAFLVGMGTEMIGVNTGKLFGSYHYGSVMGKKLNGVPYLIGINWFLVVYCTGALITRIADWMEDRYATLGIKIKPWVTMASFMIDGALIATMFDFNIEPVAIKLKFWEWRGGDVPRYNYFCWFVISMFLLWVFHKLDFDKHNQFAVHLFIIQLLFFFSLQIYLP